MDPIKFDGGDPNIFRYCGNDPVNWVDPSGENIGMISAIGAAAVLTSQIAVAGINANSIINQLQAQRDAQSRADCQYGSYEGVPDAVQSYLDQWRRDILANSPSVFGQIIGNIPGSSMTGPAPMSSVDLINGAITTGVSGSNK